MLLRLATTLAPSPRAAMIIERADERWSDACRRLGGYVWAQVMLHVLCRLVECLVPEKVTLAIGGPALHRAFSNRAIRRRRSARMRQRTNGIPFGVRFLAISPLNCIRDNGRVR